MLDDKDAVATVAVKDLPAARRFYEGVLGLEPVAEMGQDFVVFRSGNSTVNVYRSQYAGTNRATAVTWVVGDELERLVGELKSRGVRFEHYDLPGMTREGDVHVGGGMKVAWFKDPDGNILNIVNGKAEAQSPESKSSKGDGRQASRNGGTPSRGRPAARQASGTGSPRKAARR